MYLVKTYVSVSKIHGLGVFTLEHIKKGQKVWEFILNEDKFFTKEEFENLSQDEKSFIEKRGFYSEENRGWILGNDNDIFVNHSDSANIVEDWSAKYNITPSLFAVRDIEADEEITQNYYEFDDKIEVKKL